MRLKVRIKGLFILSAVLLMMGTSPVESPAAFLSPQEETKLGEMFVQSIRSQYEFADYPYLVQYVNDLGTYLGLQIEVRYFPLNFYVIKENNINAFAAPGGHVFLFSGLIRVMDDVDELASVIAHELGHVSAKHLAARVERSKKIGMATMAGILAGILAGGEAAGVLITGSVAAGIQAELGYSQEDEREADQLGFRYSCQSGFEPKGMVTVLKKIQRERWYGEGEIPPYLLTHPGTSERMATIETMAQGYRKMSDPDKAVELRSRFPLFHTMVLALCQDKEDAMREFKKRLIADPESSMAHYGLGLVLEKEGFTNEALNHLKIASKKTPDSIPIMFSLGKAYQSNGQYENSVSILNEALGLSSKDKEIMGLLALSLQHLELYAQAARIYERLTFLPPVKDTVYYNLGLVYGRQGNLAPAHYNLGIYFTRLRTGEKALFHFEKAKELAGSKPELRKKIDNALRDLKKH